MLGLIKKLFGAKPTATAPYKGEAPEATPVVAKHAKKTATKSATKPAVKAKTARKAKTPKA
jgi:hypothetical protein